MEHKGHSLLPALRRGGRRVKVQGSFSPELSGGAVGGREHLLVGCREGLQLSSAEFST